MEKARMTAGLENNKTKGNMTSILHPQHKTIASVDLAPEQTDVCAESTIDLRAAHWRQVQKELNALRAAAIAWTLAAELPDSDTTVLLFNPDASEPVWPGYHDGKYWRYADGMLTYPTHYADMPEGPTP